MIKVSKIVLDRGLQKPKAQTMQFIPDRPSRSLRILAKRVDNEGNVKTYMPNNEEKRQINNYLAKEQKEYNIKMGIVRQCY